jgi:4-hydroxy-3-polyprenylbenzoate decarboxylase
LIVAITGASGVIYGIRALEMLRVIGVETHLILTHAARTTISQETDRKIAEVESLAAVRYDYRDVGARLASGSFATDGMLIAPCSIKTLSAVANSYSNDLTSRSADVCLKEGRPLLLMVREAPLHKGHLKLMLAAVDAGAIIYPPTPAFYGRPQTLDDIVNDSVGRALARLGIDNDAYVHWKGMGAQE